MGADLLSPLRRLVVDDSGQDIVEYALLSAIIGLASLVLYGAVQTRMSKNYQDAIDGAQSIWIPAPPGGE